MAKAKAKAKAKRVARGPRGPYAGTAGRREEILRAALEVFGRRGFRSGSLREIAERVGLTQPGLIHHFGSKIGLFTEVLNSYAQKAVEEQSILPFEEEILAVVDYGESNRDFIRLFTTLSSEATDPNHLAHDYFVTRYTELHERWRASIESGQREGSIDPQVDADVVARLIVAALDGLNIQWLLGTSEEMRTPIEYLLAALFPAGRSARERRPGDDDSAARRREAGGKEARV
jgi:AcrR family transcriptional regulator